VAADAHAHAAAQTLHIARDVLGANTHSDDGGGSGGGGSGDDDAVRELTTLAEQARTHARSLSR
jgi:hypothetical protein